MRVINVELENLHRDINKLINLKMIWSVSKLGRRTPVKTGDGKMADEMEALGETFEYMTREIDELIEASISFFKNIEKEYIEADKNIAKSVW